MKIRSLMSIELLIRIKCIRLEIISLYLPIDKIWVKIFDLIEKKYWTFWNRWYAFTETIFSLMSAWKDYGNKLDPTTVKAEL